MDFEDALMTLHLRKLNGSLDSDFAEALDIIIEFVDEVIQRENLTE